LEGVKVWSKVNSGYGLPLIFSLPGWNYHEPLAHCFPLLEMTPGDLMHLKTEKKKFHLARELASFWETIGTQLGLDMQHLRNSNVDNEEKLNIIWQLWCSKTEKYLKYDPSWDGLQLLLEDVGKEQIAKEYFDFICKFY
jgi:hypothetical protein